MAKEYAPKRAADGVQEAPMTDARAWLTALIEDATVYAKVAAFTAMGRRRAYLVPPARYEELLRLEAELKELRAKESGHAR
ncbi:hypothetical protein [Streptomyces hokutonensis]|uniref:hypothetical protein n=1 Tax=Streptomyces hokutonensis TaxID=1306990 RepID=UPI0036A51008